MTWVSRLMVLKKIRLARRKKGYSTSPYLNTTWIRMFIFDLRKKLQNSYCSKERKVELDIYIYINSNAFSHYDITAKCTNSKKDYR